ncbi:MAG: class I SAM-dependent methyltransferase [Gemmatimonadaceae bacterium]
MTGSSTPAPREVAPREVDGIYRDGRHYDRLFPGSDPDLPFWVERSTRSGGPVLELACGTGRVAIPIARAGLAVTGLDSSAAMLREARAKGERAGVSVEWVEGDMRAFDVGRRFALVILLGNALCHLLDLASFEGCMACVRRHLAPGGRFIIDVFVPDVGLLVHGRDQRAAFSEYESPDGGGAVIVTSTNVYEPHTQVNRITTYHQLPGREAEETGSLDMRMYFPRELDALLGYNGFAIEEKLASYDGTPFGAGATKQLIVCRAR